MRRLLLFLPVTVCAAGTPTQVLAQRTGDNAATSAEDAFGKSVGDTSIGIYNETDVRGFSPTDAGNLRIEGLYYDQQGTLTDRLEQASTIRVGISAQSYHFPAPTGIVDYELRRPASDAIASAALTFGPRSSKFAELDVKVPLQSDQLGIAAGMGYESDRRPYGGTPRVFTAGALLRYAPRSGIEFLGFAAHYRYTDGEAQPFIFSSGDFLPKPFHRGPFRGQSWNDYAASAPSYGFLGRVELGQIEARMGVFRSVFDNDASTADLLLGTDQDGRVAQRIIVRELNDRAASTSGEFRLSRKIADGPRQHLFVAAVRGRKVDRRYGGGALIDLGPSRSDQPDPRPEPPSIDGLKSQDHVAQTILGLAYQGKWLGIGEISLGIQRTDYEKRVFDPDPNVLIPKTHSSPWLPTGTIAIHLTKKLAIYGGFARGLEESSIAPVEATNRNEAPPAIRTRQMDGGLRWTLLPGVTGVAGVFDIQKPYFNLDSQQRFRALGDVTNRGIELSLAGPITPRLTLVAGTVLLDAKISGEEVELGLIGRRPVGTFVRHTLVSADYTLPWLDGLSLDVLADSTSRRVANVANGLYVPARTILSVGGRYRFMVRSAPVLLRAQVQNLTNRFGWNVGRSGYFTPIAARSFSVSLAADL